MAMHQVLALPGAIRDRIIGRAAECEEIEEAEIEAALPEPYHEGVVLLGRGRALGYAEFGDPDGDVVLWFHGTPGACRQIPPDINEQAVARGFRVIGIERPGTGLSTAYSYDRVIDWADDVRRFTDLLAAGRSSSRPATAWPTG